MPNRVIREGILTSDKVDLLSEGAENLYRRLMSIVDDYGRYEANPRLIRSAAYPLRTERYSLADIEDRIKECAEARLLLCYQAEGKTFLELAKFGQRVRADKSKYPHPPASADKLQQPHANDGGVLTAAAHVRAQFGVVVEDGVDSREAKTKSDGVATQKPKCSHGEPSDLFAKYIGIFEASGVAMNEVDRRKTLGEFLSLDEANQQMAIVDAERKSTDGTWPEAKYTQRPYNHITGKAWTRVAKPRTLPVVERAPIRSSTSARTAAIDRLRERAEQYEREEKQASAR